MKKGSKASKKMTTGEPAKSAIENDIDSGPPQLGEDVSNKSRVESEQLDVEAMPSGDMIDGGPAPAAPPKP